MPGAGGGPQPGSGRPPSELRRRMCGTLDERLHVATDIIDNSERDSDRLGALTFLARFGLGDKSEGVVVTTALMNELAAVVARYVDEDEQGQIKDEWIGVLRRHLGR